MGLHLQLQPSQVCLSLSAVPCLALALLRHLQGQERSRAWIAAYRIPIPWESQCGGRKGEPWGGAMSSYPRGGGVSDWLSVVPEPSSGDLKSLGLCIIDGSSPK
jgi:hypothetical protein